MQENRMIRVTAGLACALAVTGCTEDGDLPIDPVTTPPPAVFINEFLTSSDTTFIPECGSSDWIELYSADTTAIALASLTLTDSPEDDVPWSIPSSDSLRPGEWCVICADGLPGLGPLHANFKLKNGETIQLGLTSGTILDAVRGPFLADDESYGRIPDGSTDWTVTMTPTPGEPNG